MVLYMVLTVSTLMKLLTIRVYHIYRNIFSCMLVLHILIGLPDVLIYINMFFIFVNMYVLFVL